MSQVAVGVFINTPRHCLVKKKQICKYGFHLNHNLDLILIHLCMAPIKEAITESEG